MNMAADNIRILAASMVEKAKSGHPGGAMGGADFINTLYSEFLVYDPENPAWEGRDRFFLDPGHMAPMLYSQLTLIGKYKITTTFCHFTTTLQRLFSQSRSVFHPCRHVEQGKCVFYEFLAIISIIYLFIFLTLFHTRIVMLKVVKVTFS